MVTLLTVVHITVCLFLILVVLLQAGKGGGMGIAFGGSGSQTVFGSSGAGNFLTRLTSITATIFLVTSLSLAYYSSRQDSKRLQQLSTQKAAEKKVEDEKAAKLKAEMEKIRAAAAIGKDAGAAGNTPESATGVPGAPGATGTPGPTNLPSVPGTAPMIPLKLKMPTGPANTGTAAPEGAKATTENPGTKAATPKMKKAGAAPVESGAPGTPRPTTPAAPTTTGESAPPSTDQVAPKPVVKRRKPVAPAAPASGESQTSPAPVPEKPPAPPPAAE